MQELLSELATMMKMTTLTIMTTLGKSKQVLLGNRLAARCTSVLVTSVVLWCTEPVPMQGCFCHCLSSSLPVIVVVHAAEPSEKRDHLVSHRLFRSITCAVSIICILYLLQRHAGGDGQALPFSASLLPCFGLSCWLICTQVRCFLYRLPILTVNYMDWFTYPSYSGDSGEGSCGCSASRNAGRYVSVMLLPGFQPKLILFQLRFATTRRTQWEVQTWKGGKSLT